MLKIMGGHQSISDQIVGVSVQFVLLSAHTDIKFSSCRAWI